MIQIQYSIPVTGGSLVAVQETQAAVSPLDEGELDFLALTLASDVTTHIPGGMIERTIQLNETAEFLDRIGVPVTAAKRKASVAHLFDYKLTQRLRKRVGEMVTLF